MKKITLILILILLFACSTLLSKNANKYAIKSAHIKYDLTGNITGEKEVWFDDYGTKYYEEAKTTTTIEMFGIKNTEEEHKISITNDGIHYEIDMINKTGYKSKMPEMEAFRQYAENMSKEEQEKFKNDILDSFGGKMVGEEKFMGKECEIMEVMGRKSWLYKGITLKAEGSMMGVVNNEVATKIEENIDVPASRFEPTAGISYEEIPEYGSSMDEEFEEEPYQEEDYEEGKPVPISLEEFKQGLVNIEKLGYKSQGFFNEDIDSYTAMFANDSKEILIIGATAYDDMDEDEEGVEIETFSHKGKTMKYGIMSEEGQEIYVLLILYSDKDLVISLSSLEKLKKEGLVKIADELEF